MKFLSFVFFAVVLVCQPALATEEAVDYNKFEQFVQKLMKEFKVPGLAVGIVDREKNLYMKGFGVRGVEEKLPVTSDTQFAIGSTSKAFTATGMGILVDRKQLNWDAPIKENYLLDFELQNPLATELATPRDLLTHRIGLPRHDLVWYGMPLSRKEIYERLKYLQPTASIREKVQYQNMMFMTAGYLVGQTQGTTWEAFTQENILDKIGMTNTNFSVVDMQNANDFALPHASDKDGIKQIPFRNIDAIGPAGSMNSSVNDMGKWLRLQMNEGELDGVRVISKEALAEIHKPQMVSSVLGFDKIFPEFGTEHYAMAWFEQTYLNEKLVHHGGGIDGFITFVGFLPKKDVGIVVFGNTGGLVPYFVALGYLDLLLKGEIGPWEQRMRDFMKEPEPKPLESTPTPLTIEKYLGTYSHPAYGDIKIAKATDSNMIELQHPVLAMKLQHYKDNSFLPMLADGKLNGLESPVIFASSSDEVVSLKYKADAKADQIVFEKISSSLAAEFRTLLPIMSEPIEVSSPMMPLYTGMTSIIRKLWGGQQL